MIFFIPMMTSTKIWQCAVFENKHFLKILFYQKKMLSDLYFIKYWNFWGKFIIFFFFQIILRLDEIWDTKICRSHLTELIWLNSAINKQAEDEEHPPYLSAWCCNCAMEFFKHSVQAVMSVFWAAGGWGSS